MWDINIADWFSICTTVIVFVWFLFVRKKQYLDKYLIGKYSIFTSLRGNPSSTAIFNFEITNTFETGWFSGRLNFSEPYNNPQSRSEGETLFIGFVKYGFYQSLVSIFKGRSKSIPLDLKSNQKIQGTVYLLMRNDIDISLRDWKEFVTRTYNIQHFPQAGRIKLSLKTVNSNLDTLVPDELSMVNTNLFPDNMFKII